MNVLRATAWLCVFAAAACSDEVPSAQDEIAQELRALRLALAHQPLAAPPAAAPAAGGELQSVLQPLRGAIEALTTSQRELAERQVLLTQEMQRWSQLLVEAVGSAHAAEAKSMAKKLAEFEASLQSQDARHREVEALMQKALDHTSDQLDAFLKRLQGGSLVVPAPGERKSDAAPPPPAVNASGGAGAPGGERQAALEVRTKRPASQRWWWAALALCGVLVATFFGRRSRRPARAVLAPNPPAAVELPAAPALPAVPPERSVEEIWAAAALLGEAVDRLRERAAQPPAEPSLSVPAPLPTGEQHDDGDEAFVLADDDGDDEQPAPSAPPAAPAVAAPHRAPAADGPLVWQVAAAPVGQPAARLRQLEVLAGERCVLRRPAPVFVDRGDPVLRFYLLPDTGPAEQSRLLQRLRESARG